MSRFRNRRRRIAALALLPVTATMMIATGATTAAGSGTGFDASNNRVGPHGTVTLSGHFTAPKVNAAGGAQQGSRNATQSVRIQFRAFGADNWHDAKRTETGRKGKFSERVGVSRSGRFRAVSSDGRATGAELVRVKSKTQARVSTKNAQVGDKVRVKGHVAPGAAGRKVVVKIGGKRIRTRTGNSGKFSVAWKADSAGKYAVRVKADGDRIAAGSGRKAGKVEVFRGALASYYGPGLYGNRMACGGTLQPSTVGVANKSLPCGTKLTFRYKGKEVKTEVIDRGPYVGSREFDLTEALRNKLGFGSTGTVLVNK